MENEIMRFEEVMEFLSIGKNTLYALLNHGEINAFRIGKVWKIPKKSVEEYIEKKVNGNSGAERKIEKSTQYGFSKK